MVGERDLELAVAALRHADERRLHALQRQRRPGGDERRPGSRAAAGTGALAGPVLVEDVERVAARVDEGAAERRRTNGDLRVRRGCERGRDGDREGREREEEESAHVSSTPVGLRSDCCPSQPIMSWRIATATAWVRVR